MQFREVPEEEGIEMPTQPQLAKNGDIRCLVMPELKACRHFEREGRKTCQECIDWEDPELAPEECPGRKG